MARVQDGALLNTLRAGFKYIEDESFQSAFSGLFSEINLASEKPGGTYADRNAKLRAIVSKIAGGLAAFSTDTDTLGDAYEYLIGQFAAGSLLLNVRKHMGSESVGRIFGQEKNVTTCNLARMNMLLRGVKDWEFEIHHGDTLTNDWDMLRETNPAKGPGRGAGQGHALQNPWAGPEVGGR